VNEPGAPVLPVKPDDLNDRSDDCRAGGEKDSLPEVSGEKQQQREKSIRVA
jgi:hypothetical protein